MLRAPGEAARPPRSISLPTADEGAFGAVSGRRTDQNVPVRPVLRLPDHFLKEPAAPVGRIDDAARTLAADLVDTMRASPACVGIAATQIGVGVRAFTVDVTGHKKAVSCHGQVNEMKVVAHDQVLSMGWCLRCHNEPAPSLRPVTEVTNLTWAPAGGRTQGEIGREIKKDLQVSPPMHCQSCHR